MEKVDVRHPWVGTQRGGAHRERERVAMACTPQLCAVELLAATNVRLGQPRVQPMTQRIRNLLHALPRHESLLGNEVSEVVSRGGNA